MAVTRIQFRRGTASEWASENAVLSDGEPGYEHDTGRVKLGDATTPWNELGYVGDPVQPMTLEEVLSDTPPSAPATVSPLILGQAVIELLERAGLSNVYMMAIWNGDGAHPVRPELPDTMFVIWRQPTAPLVGDEYSHDGDEWEVTEG